MNPLLSHFPTALSVGGAVYPIDADFRTCLRILLAFEDDALLPFEKQAVMLRLLYKERPPDDMPEACRKAVLFLDCGEMPSESEGGASGQRFYSFAKDAKYIYSAIRQTHGVDLETVDFLHWWKFCYMFLDLREDTAFQGILTLRRRKADGRLTKEERDLWYRFEDVLALPQTADPERAAAEAAFNRAMGLTV